MLLRNSTSWRHAFKLGAINGLLFGAIAGLVLAGLYAYEWGGTGSKSNSGLILDFMPFQFKWWYLPLLSLVLVSLATFLVNRYLAPAFKSPILLWQIIGFSALLECYTVTFAIDLWNANFSLNGADYWLLADSMKPALWGLLAVALSGFNLVFALLLYSITRKRVSSSQ